MRNTGKYAGISAAVGLGILIAVLLSGTAYPHPMFRVGAPLGLAFVFVSVVLLIVDWVREIYKGVKERRYLWAAAVAALGLIVLIRILTRG